jgi:hypothetical protein
MADLKSAAPVETEKSGAYLHTREQIPEAPEGGGKVFLSRNAIVFAGILFTIGITAIAFTARDGWTTHRDFVTALPVPLWSMGGIALGLLAVRSKWNAASFPLIFILVSIMLAGFMLLRNDQAGGPESTRRALAAISGLFLLVGVHWMVGNAVKSEVSDPVKPPPPAG